MQVPPSDPNMSNFTVLDSSVDTLNKNHELRKRRGSYPLVNKSEVLSAEMLAPLPQGNISKVPSSIDLLAEEDNETQPLIKVRI